MLNSSTQKQMFCNCSTKPCLKRNQMQNVWLVWMKTFRWAMSDAQNQFSNESCFLSTILFATLYLPGDNIFSCLKTFAICIPSISLFGHNKTSTLLLFDYYNCIEKTNQKNSMDTLKIFVISIYPYESKEETAKSIYYKGHT